MLRITRNTADSNVGWTRASGTIFDEASGLTSMQQLIQLRWVAVIGQIITIATVHFLFKILLPLEYMLAVLAWLVAFNIASQIHWHSKREVSNDALFFALLVDVGTLTAQLYLSGGATNPFSFLYLLQVILAAVLLQPKFLRAIVVVTSTCFAGLTVFHFPLDLIGHDGLSMPYIEGTLVCFALDAALLAIFITRVNSNQRARDARLADLRQRAAEEEHIVRMGLLASGAAHELSTPLATLAVILGDWKRMPPFTTDPEMLQEIKEMQTQVLRCKSIVTGILLSAGETRGEAPAETTVHTFLDELVADWRTTRPVNRFTYRNHFGQDLRIVSDSAFRQMICNVLDNALEASPHWVGLIATREADTLILTITDGGPGFANEMLERLGKPYQSSKGRPGGGLGLFLVVNVARTLGGSVTAHNRPEGGAIVTLTLPLAVITLGDEKEEEKNGSE